MNLVDLHPYIENQPDNQVNHYVDLDDVFSITVESYEYEHTEVNRIELKFKSTESKVELIDSPEVRVLLGVA